MERTSPLYSFMRTVLGVLNLIAFILILIIPQISAIGITPSTYEIFFEPNLTTAINFFVLNRADYNMSVTFSVSGGLVEYTTVPRRTAFLPAHGEEEFHVLFQFPQSVPEPGMHILTVTASEVPTGGGGISATTSVSSPVRISVPYPDKFLTASYELKDVALGERLPFTIQMKNPSVLNISAVKAKIEIYDASNLSVYRSWTQRISIPAGSSSSLSPNINTSLFGGGRFTLLSYVQYDRILTQPWLSSFIIGAQSIILTNITPTIYAERIGRVDLSLLSFWNQELDASAHIFLFLPDGQFVEATTPTVAVQPFSSTKLSVYLDMGNVPPGTYPLNVSIQFGDRTSFESSALEVIAIEPPPVKRQSILWVLLGIGVVILLIDIIFMLQRRTKRIPIIFEK